jgi:hypothetical protein
MNFVKFGYFGHPQHNNKHSCFDAQIAVCICSALALRIMYLSVHWKFECVVISRKKTGGCRQDKSNDYANFSLFCGSKQKKFNSKQALRILKLSSIYFF